MADDLNMWVGNRLPSVTDTITIDGAPVDLTGATVKFMMREESSATPKVNATATVVDVLGGQVRYDWAALDVDTKGEYRAWFRVTMSGKDQDTPEFTVNFLAHDATPVIPWLCSVADYREQTEQSSTSTTPDELIEAMIEAASLALSQRYGREFLTSYTGARRLEVHGPLVNLFPFDLHAAPSSVVLHPESGSPTTLTLNTDFVFTRSTGNIAFRFLRLAPGVNVCSDLYRHFGFAYLDVTATSWGMFATSADVPADLRRACVLTVASWLDRPVSDYAAQDFGVGGGGYRPSSFTGWPIPAAAHKLVSAYTVPVVG